MRTSRKVVTFDRPFELDGLDGQQPAGSYLVVTDEEPIANILFDAWRRVATTIRIPALGINSGIEQVVAINPENLAAALAKDAANDARTSDS